MTNSARLSGRPSSSAAYNVGDVVDTPDSAIKSWRYLGAGEWEPNDAVRYTMGPGGGNRISAGGQRLYTTNPRWWQHAQPQAIRRPLITPGVDTVSFHTSNGGVATLAPAEDSRFSPIAVNFTVPDGGAASKFAGVECAIDADLTLDDVIVLYFYVPEDVGGIFSISAWLFQAGPANGIGATFETSTSIQYPGAGVIACARKVADLTGTGPKPSDNTTYQNYKVLRVQESGAAGGAAGRTQFLHAEVVRRRTPMVCITADDGFLAVRDVGAPVFNSYGVPMTLYVIADRPYGPPANYMTWADINRLAGKGNSICNHTANHTQAGTATVDEWASDTMRAMDILKSQGHEVGARHFAWVQGVRSKPYVDRAKQIGLLSARTVLSRGVYGSYGVPSPYDIGGISSTGRTAAQMLADIDIEVGRGADCTCVLHDFHETTNDGLIMSRAEATALAKGLRERAEAGTIIVGTVPELWARRQAEAGWSPEF